MKWMKRFNDADKGWVSSYFPEKRQSEASYRLGISHISREEFLGAGPTTCPDISDLRQYNDILKVDFRKKK